MDKNKSSLWWVYLIETHQKTLYCGISTDVDRRFSEHSSESPKSARSLRGKGPLKLVFRAEVGTRSEALKMEAAVRRLTRQQKLRLIDGDSLVFAKLGLPQADKA